MFRELETFIIQHLIRFVFFKSLLQLEESIYTEAFIFEYCLLWIFVLFSSFSSLKRREVLVSTTKNMCIFVLMVPLPSTNYMLFCNAVGIPVHTCTKLLIRNSDDTEICKNTALIMIFRI